MIVKTVVVKQADRQVSRILKMRSNKAKNFGFTFENISIKVHSSVLCEFVFINENIKFGILECFLEFDQNILESSRPLTNFSWSKNCCILYFTQMVGKSSRKLSDLNTSNSETILSQI